MIRCFSEGAREGDAASPEKVVPGEWDGRGTGVLFPVPGIRGANRNGRQKQGSAPTTEKS